MYAKWDQYSAVEPSTDEQEPEELNEPRIPAGTTELESSVWEDEDTLHWKLRMAKYVEVQGGTSIQVDAFVKGPRPQVQQLVLVEPTNRYDLKLREDLGVPREAQWWFLGIPLQCKLSNVTQDNMKIEGGLVIATVYAVNNNDRERIKSVINPVSEEPTSPKQDEVIKEKDKWRPPEQRDKGGEIADIPSEATQVDLGEANFGQLSPSEKDTLMGILNEYIDVFAVNPKSVPACKGVAMRLELKDLNLKPYVALIRYYSQEQREMIQTEVAKHLKNGSIRESTSEWAANCSTARKKDRTVRVVQDFRRANALLKSPSGGPRGLATHYGRDGRVEVFLQHQFSFRILRARDP